MASTDTSSAARAVQIEAYRRMGPGERLKLAWQLSEGARRLSAAGVRRRHADYSDEEVHWALLRLVHGDDLYRRVWPEAPVLEP